MIKDILSILKTKSSSKFSATQKVLLYFEQMLYRGKKPLDDRSPLLTYSASDVRCHQSYLRNPQSRQHGVLTFVSVKALQQALRAISQTEVQIFGIDPERKILPNLARADQSLYTHPDNRHHVSIRPFFSHSTSQMTKPQFDDALSRIQVKVVEMKEQGEDSPDEDNFGPASIRALNAYGRDLISDVDTVNEGLFCRVAAVLLMENGDAWLSNESLSRKEIDLLSTALTTYRRSLIRDEQSTITTNLNDIAQLNSVLDLVQEKIPWDDAPCYLLNSQYAFPESAVESRIQ